VPSERSTEGFDRRASIAREHLLGATVWAYGGGAARVRPWTTARDIRMPQRVIGETGGESGGE